MPAKDKVVASIAQAQLNLEQALADLEHLPTFGTGALSFAAHALDNYLTVTAGTVRLLMRALRGHPNQRIHTGLETLEHVTNLMAHTAHQLMSTSATQGSPKLILERLDLVMLAHTVSGFYQLVAERKQIHIHIIVEAPIDSLYVRTDRVVVAAILDNLLSNAVKFSPFGSRIWVRVATENNHPIISLQDEGSGLSKEDQDNLFQKGVRLSAVPTAGEPSTGYGLAVAKDLADQISGEIRCESPCRREAGQREPGARFTFHLPPIGGTT